MPRLTLCREGLERVYDPFAKVLGYVARRDDLLEDEVGRADVRRVHFADAWTLTRHQAFSLGPEYVVRQAQAAPLSLWSRSNPLANHSSSSQLRSSGCRPGLIEIRASNLPDVRKGSTVAHVRAAGHIQRHLDTFIETSARRYITFDVLRKT